MGAFEGSDCGQDYVGTKELTIKSAPERQFQKTRPAKKYWPGFILILCRCVTQCRQ